MEVDTPLMRGKYTSDMNKIFNGWVKLLCWVMVALPVIRMRLATDA
jgi:hypothetical protein